MVTWSTACLISSPSSAPACTSSHTLRETWNERHVTHLLLLARSDIVDEVNPPNLHGSVRAGGRGGQRRAHRSQRHALLARVGNGHLLHVARLLQDVVSE